MPYISFLRIKSSLLLCCLISFVIPLNLVNSEENSIRSTMIKSLRTHQESDTDRSKTQDYCLTNNCPWGDYWIWCSDCTYDSWKAKLSCKCKGNDGVYKDTSYTGDCFDYQVFDGKLVCFNPTSCRSVRCRPGPFRRVCTDCYESKIETLDGLIECICDVGGQTYERLSFYGQCGYLEVFFGKFLCFPDD